MHRQGGHQREARALDELRVALGPLHGLGDGERPPPEQVPAELIADVPRVERPHPALGLRLGDARGFVHDGRQQPRLVDPAAPQLPRQRVVSSQLTGKPAQRHH